MPIFYFFNTFGTFLDNPSKILDDLSLGWNEIRFIYLFYLQYRTICSVLGALFDIKLTFLDKDKLKKSCTHYPSLNVLIIITSNCFNTF